ncbi:MAG TPA: GNAT family N-acetyltransferase, partial [Planococcus sp. (in: firmicutes)]|nr:GNAT family N-acetyltransferase [Planococcus sp. (in: firmicutes)]
MNKHIRPLNMEDLPYLEAMNTGIEDDYVIRVFKRISSGTNRMYGLFWDDQLVSVGGYSIFARSYAMLGRMRSDLRYRSNDLSTQLMSHVIQEVFKLPEIQWVGANTQEENSPARRVLAKLGLSEHSTLFGATTQDVSMLSNGRRPWREVESLESKKQWLD